jgi:hypothetical protein
MRSSIFASVFGLVFALGCSSQNNEAAKPATDAGNQETATQGQAVTSIEVPVEIPAEFAGKAIKAVFGYHTERVVDDAGKFLKVPTFVPSMAGIANPAIEAGKTFTLTLDGVDVPAGEYYTVVAFYAEGSAGTIPEAGKDWVGGSSQTVKFAGPKAVLPSHALIKAGGM